MSLTQLKTCNFGKSYANGTGSLGVGYTIYDEFGAIATPRSTTGVIQTISGSGVYFANVVFPDDFNGQIFWDTGSVFASIAYASEQYNYEENNPKIDDIYTKTLQISSSIESIKDIEYGRWKIQSNQMIFYKEDNATEVARFNLYNNVGAPTMDSVFERVKV